MRATPSPTSALVLSAQDLESGAFLWPSPRKRSDRDLHYPTADLNAAIVQWISNHAQPGSPHATRDLVAHGLEERSIVVDGRELLVLRESLPLRAGTGTFVLSAPRPRNGPLLVIQAPHEPFDKGTRVLAWSLFRHALARLDHVALVVNSAHRYEEPGTGAPEAQEHPYDVCHNPDHPFHRASLALVQSHPHITVLQLHGFSSDSANASQTSRERPPAGTRAVVSSGQAKPPFAARDAWAGALRQSLGAGVIVFPDDTAALGATTNVLAQALADRPNSFVHVELASATREQLTGDHAAREAWARVTIEAVCSAGALTCQAEAH